MKTLSPISTRLFLSYARADDPEFVERLATDLSEHGFTVWLDKSSMESRGESFLAEIQKAITAIDRLVLVCGPHVGHSEYVLWEIRQALDLCKPVVPVLRQGGPQALPPELARLQLHYVDAQDDAEYERALAELLRLLRSPLSALGKLFWAPGLPPHYLVRRDVLEKTKATLLPDHRQPIVVTGAAERVGVEGMGGIGKTVLATAVARDCEVRWAFPDGIFWCSIGRNTANLARHQYNLIQALSGDARGLADESQLRGRLSELLAGRTVLLVLDDVWQMDQVTAFGTLGSNSRMLITTRNAGLVTDIGAIEQPIDVLNDDEALSLLAKWTDHPSVDHLPSEARAVARRCGNLPLALALVGAMARHKPHLWSSILRKLTNADLQGIMRRDFPDPHRSLLQAIQVSVEDLPPSVQERYLDLAVVPDHGVLREHALRVLWKALGLDLEEAQDALELLIDRSLLTRGQDGGLRLHDLLRDYIRGRVPDPTRLHDHLLRGYAAECPGGWPSGPDDGYFFEHLAFHLLAAGRRHELFALLTSSSEWMDAKLGPCQGDASFVSDLELALSVLVEPLAPSELRHWIALHMARLVVAERIGRYKDDDLAILSLLGRDLEALNHARLHEPGGRISSLLAIYEAQRRRGQPDHRLLDEVEATLSHLEDAYWRTRALIDFAEVLLPERDQRVTSIFDEVFQIGPTLQTAGPREWTLCRLSALLFAAGDPRAGMVLEQARAATEWPSMTTNWLKWPALAALQHGSPEIASQLGKLLTGIDSIEVLCAQALALHHSGDERFRVLLKEAETEARRWFSSPHVDSVEGLGAIAEALSAIGDPRADSVFQEAVEAAGQITDEDEVTSPETNQDLALLYLAQAAARCSRFELAETIVSQIHHFWHQQDALRALCKSLALAGDTRAPALFDKLVESQRAVKLRNYETSSILGRMASALILTGQLDRAWAVARSISPLDPLAQMDALLPVAVALAAQGREEDAGVALDEAAAALDRDESPNHSGGEARFTRALARAGRIPEAERTAERNRVLWAGAPIAEALARQGRFDLAEARARRIDDEVERALALLDVAAAAIEVGQDSAQRLYSETAATLRGNRGWIIREESLAEVTIALGRLHEAQAIIDEIGSEGSRENLLQELTMALAQQRAFIEAESVARRIQTSGRRIATLAELAIALHQVGDGAGCERLLAELAAIPEQHATVRLAQLRVQYRRAGGDGAAVDALARSIEDHWFAWTKPSRVLQHTEVWLAAAGRFPEAFSELGPYNLMTAIQAFVRWVPAFERVEAGLALDVLRTSLRIASWQSDEWAPAARALGVS